MTVFANLVDGEVKGVYDLIPKFWNGINHFDIRCRNDEQFMRDNGFVRIVRDLTPFDPVTHRMSDFPTYTVENGQVIEHREITPVPPVPPVIPTTRDELLFAVRQRRDQLMAEFEWRYTRYYRQKRLELPTTDTIESLDAYMQALADITLQEDVNSIVWPIYNG